MNTWHGKDETETWTQSSSILQLLISLQSLVLTREPYYNEAGFEKFVGTEEAMSNSALYNEKAYLLSLRFVQTVLRASPICFESEISWFYLDNGGLEKVIQRGEEIIRNSEIKEGDESPPDDDEFIVSYVSKGALKLMRRTIDGLKSHLSKHNI